jgi:hypothetical protein
MENDTLTVKKKDLEIYFTFEFFFEMFPLSNVRVSVRGHNRSPITLLLYDKFYELKFDHRGHDPWECICLNLLY